MIVKMTKKWDFRSMESYNISYSYINSHEGFGLPCGLSTKIILRPSFSHNTIIINLSSLCHRPYDDKVVYFFLGGKAVWRSS